MKKLKIELPNELFEDNILAAIEDYTLGSVEHDFAQSDKFDLLHKGTRYPPKAITGLAILRQTGMLPKPSDFSGGANSKCFRLLREAGVRVVPKAGTIPFIVGSKYGRADIKDNIGTREDTTKGDWATGYHQHFDKEASIDGWFFVFANVGASGRTGHDYKNYWLDDKDFAWQAKPHTNIQHDQINKLASGDYPVLLFIRNNDRDPFVYRGLVTAHEINDTTPVSVVWRCNRMLASPPANEINTRQQTLPITSEYEPSDEDHRDVVLREIKQRRGQPKFRKELIAAYEGKCVITDCDIVEILEAAHINPFRGIKDNHISNGLLLRADIHTLFDLNLLAIHPIEMCVYLSTTLQKLPYKQFEGRKLSFNTDISVQALWNRWEQFIDRS